MTTPAGSAPEPLPFDELHAELGDHPEGRAALDSLRSALASDSTARGDVERHVSFLQAIPILKARIANWIDSPGTQRWLDGLSEIGL